MAVSRGYLSTVMGRAQQPLASSSPAVRRVAAPPRRVLHPSTVSPSALPAPAATPSRPAIGTANPSPRFDRSPEQSRQRSTAPEAPPSSAPQPRSREGIQPIVITIPKGRPPAEGPLPKLRDDHSAPAASPPAKATEVLTTTEIREPGVAPAREVEFHTVLEEVPAVQLPPPQPRELPPSPREPRSFRVRWPDKAPAVSAQVRERVEREIIRTARTEWRNHVERVAAPVASPPVVDIHVGQITVKIEAPPQPPPPIVQPAQAPRTGQGDEGFSSYFLRRSISGF